MVMPRVDMARRDDVPQTVGEAVACGWEWLRVRCSFCGRSARIMFATQPAGEPRIARAARDLPPMRRAYAARLQARDDDGLPREGHRLRGQYREEARNGLIGNAAGRPHDSQGACANGMHHLSRCSRFRPQRGRRSRRRGCCRGIERRSRHRTRLCDRRHESGSGRLLPHCRPGSRRIRRRCILARFGETPSNIEPATSQPAMAIHSSKPIGRRGSLRRRCEVP